MSDVSLAHWGLVIFLFGLMCVYAFALARYLVQLALRLSEKKNRGFYGKWGVDEVLFWPTSSAWFVAWGLVVFIFTGFTFLFTLFSTLLLTDATRIGGDQIYETFTFFSIAFILGAAVEFQRFEDVRRKVTKLEGLRETFHKRFRTAELLSIYESLQHAPPLF